MKLNFSSKIFSFVFFAILLNGLIQQKVQLDYQMSQDADFD